MQDFFYVNVSTHSISEPCEKRPRLRSRKLELKCEICMKIWNTVGGYKRHMLVHSEDRKYRCQYCEYRFRRETMLKIHLKTHKEHIEKLETLMLGKDYSVHKSNALFI